MQLCKACGSLMIGHEANAWLRSLKRLLRHHGADPDSLTVVAESLGPMCDKCLKAMDKSIRQGWP
jgi:hypothetical protein